jgi:hypothetical protein
MDGNIKMKTLREFQTLLEKILLKISLLGILSNLLNIYQFYSPLPQRIILLGATLETNTLINVVLIFSLGYVVCVIWVSLFKVKSKVTIESFIDTSNSPAIRLSNLEPVNLKDFTIEVVRFSDQKEIWNTIKVLTSGNNYLSDGLSEDKTVSRIPVDIKIASSIALDNVTAILTDKNPIYRPLNKINDNVFSREFELILKISCRPEDERSSCVLGLYYGKFSHTQTKAHDQYARQNDFYWKTEMRKIQASTDKKMKKEREKTLGFFLTS